MERALIETMVAGLTQTTESLPKSFDQIWEELDSSGVCFRVTRHPFDGMSGLHLLRVVIFHNTEGVIADFTRSFGKPTEHQETEIQDDQCVNEVTWLIDS